MNQYPRILLVEDSPTQAASLGKFLTELGFEVIIADDGPVGLSAAVEYDPLAIILDVNLPTMNGYQVARRLKRQPETANIPIIMLSKRDGTRDMVQGLDHGADYYIPKGPDANEEILKTLGGFGLVIWR